MEETQEDLNLQIKESRVSKIEEKMKFFFGTIAFPIGKNGSHIIEMSYVCHFCM
jgi:hypothetical protein